MRNLRLSEWANIAEIVASIVIVASLAYIGMELNQNTQALQQESYQTTVATMIDLDIAEATNEDLSRIVLLGMSSPGELTPGEWYIFVRVAYARFAVWEYVFLSTRENAISHLQWTALEPYFIDLSCSIGFNRFWTENKIGFSPEFASYFETSSRLNCPEIYD